MQKVTLRQYRGSQLRVAATAPTLELMRASNDFFATDASVSLAGQGTLILAHEVKGNGVTEIATGSRGVRFLGADGTVGSTETATWDRALGPKGGAAGDAGVSIDHPRFHLDAEGFFADFESERVLFDKPSTVTRPQP